VKELFIQRHQATEIETPSKNGFESVYYDNEFLKGNGLQHSQGLCLAALQPAGIGIGVQAPG
jgi:hypothetical protein